MFDTTHIGNNVTSFLWKENVGEKKEQSYQEDHELDHPIIGLHPMNQVFVDDYINDHLVIDIPYMVMDKFFNAYEGMDTHFDLDELDIELDEFHDKFELDM